MDHWIAELTSDLLWAEDLTTARDAFRRIARQVNVEHYAYGNARPGLERPFVDTTYPEDWIHHYFAKGYQFIDPVIEEARRTHLPFAWRFLTNRAEGLSPEQRQLFAEAAEHGIRDGFTIPFHSAIGGFAVLSFAFPSIDHLKVVMRAQAKLKLLGVYYHAVIERLLETETADEDLSAMERQCLTWADDDGSRWEISGLVHRPESDVARALRSAREKIGATTTAQAVAKAIAQGLIAP